MDIDHAAVEIQNYFETRAATDSLADIESFMTAITSTVDPSELYVHCCQTFDRFSVEQLFLYTSHLWCNVSGCQLMDIVSSIHPRPSPVWSPSDGWYGDIVFFLAASV